ncbi:MAG: DinB family protein [Candidatus Kariarchaeaceae archaeon]|jgi:uncharacterized damage-inducible protein DinB
MVVQLQQNKNLDPKVGFILSGLRETREILLKTIKDFSQEELDYTPHTRRFESIATLLFHIAAVEFSWIMEDINGKEMKEEEWKLAFALRDSVNEDQVKDKPLSFYLSKLQEVRSEIETWIKGIRDGDLARVVEIGGDKFTVEWILYHVGEHELTHIGQIRLLKRLHKLHAD